MLSLHRAVFQKSCIATGAKSGTGSREVCVRGIVRRQKQLPFAISCQGKLVILQRIAINSYKPCSPFVRHGKQCRPRSDAALWCISRVDAEAGTGGPSISQSMGFSMAKLCRTYPGMGFTMAKLCRNPTP